MPTLSAPIWSAPVFDVRPTPLTEASQALLDAYAPLAREGDSSYVARSHLGRRAALADRLREIEDAARLRALAPYNAVANGASVDWGLYKTDPLYHATIYRMTRAGGPESTLRRLLWAHHGHDALYGDDGELQCHSCGLDYLRASALDIDARWAEMDLLAAGTPHA